MLNDMFFRKLQKLINESRLTTNELFQVKCHLERQYNKNLTEETLIRLIDNVGTKNKEKKEIVSLDI